MPNDSRPTPPVKRILAPRACQRCKTLRRGCNEYRPCRRCVDAGLSDQCVAQSRPAALTGAGRDPSQRLSELVPSQIIDHCVERFFARLYPTIPILTIDHVISLKGSPLVEAHAVLAAMCAQVLLQAEEPENLLPEGVIRENSITYGTMILESAVAAHLSIPRNVKPSLNQCLLAFFLYACHARLSHHSQAFLFLREATTLFCLLRLDDMDHAANALAGRLFWVLLVSERSHAIRYRRPITLQITSETPELEMGDPSLVGFWSLAALFRPIDTSFVALLNQEIVATTPPLASLDYVETSVNTALKADIHLHDTQKANLRITQLWLRVIIWKLRLRLGHLSEDAHQHSLRFQYPLEVAKDLTLSTRDLPLNSIKVHGVGLTEKLYDVVSAVVDVLARVPVNPSSPQGLAMGTSPQDDLAYIRGLMSQLPGGTAIYEPLLVNHIEQALPSPGPSMTQSSPTGSTIH